MMNKSVFVIILITLASQSIESRNTTVARINLFSNLNRQLHNLSSTLFKSLKLDKNFKNMNKTNILIKMADDLIKLSERKFKMYREIHNATKIGTDNKAINPLFNLTRIIEEIFKEEHYFLHSNKFLRNNSLIEFYEAVVSNSNWLEKSLNDWENSDNNTYMAYRRRGSAKAFRRKYQERIIGLLNRRVINELLPWRASNQTDLPSRRIFGSIPVNVKKYPFIASLLLMGEFVCAGCIISKDMVLTAASCLQIAYKNPHLLDKRDAVAIRVGSDFPNKGGEVTPITDIYYHSKYDPVHLYNNLAICRLESSLNFLRAKKKVRRIEFVGDNKDIAEKTGITLLGWGDQNELNSYNGPLTMARLEVYNLKACQKIYTAQYVTETDFCAGFVDIGTGACNRDVGGPGFIGSYLVGVVNFGSPICGTPNGPTVFTKIGNYSSWIDSVLAKVNPNNTKTRISNHLGKRNKTRPLRTRYLKHKENAIEQSALELLTSILHDLKLDVLLNADLNVDIELPDEEPNSDKTTKHPIDSFFGIRDLRDDMAMAQFWEKPETTSHKDLHHKKHITHVKQLFAPTTTTTQSTSPEYEITESNLADLMTLPQGAEDLDPEILSQLNEIKNIIDPIFVTTTPSYSTKAKLQTEKLFLFTNTPEMFYESDPREIPGQAARIQETITDMHLEEDNYDDISVSDKEKSDVDRASNKDFQDVLKNWDVSTNEVMGKSESEEAKYQKRRLTTSATTNIGNSVTKRKHKTSFRAEDEASDVVKSDVKMPIEENKVIENQDGTNQVKAVILTAVDETVRERDMAHYQGSEEGVADDEPTRRLLDYVNI